MESQHSYPGFRDAVPGEERQTFPRLTQGSLSQTEDLDVDTPLGEISFSRTTTEIADDDAFGQIESHSVDTPTGETSFSQTPTEIADDDFLSRLSIDEFTENSEAQQNVPLGNEPATKTGNRAKKLLQSVTKWKEDIQYLIGSQIDGQDLKRSLGTIKDDMASTIADCNDERARLIAAITKLAARNTALSVRLRQQRSVGQPKQVAIAKAELDGQRKKKKMKKAPTEYLQDAQCRALTLCGEGSPEPVDIPMSTATRSAGWSSQQLPKTRRPPPLTIENLGLPRQRSVGGDWTQTAFGTSKLEPSQSPSTEFSPDTPTGSCKSTEVTNKRPKHGTKKRGSIASIPQRLSTIKPAPAPTKRRSQKALGSKPHRTPKILGTTTELTPQAYYPTGVLRDSMSPGDLTPPNTIMHSSEEEQGFDQEESDEGKEEVSNQNPMSRFSSRPLSLNVQPFSRFSTWIFDQPIGKILSMARLRWEGQSLDQELDTTVEVEEASDWDPASQRSSRYINPRSKRRTGRSSYVLYDTGQDLHIATMDDGGARRNPFGQNKSAGDLFKRVVLAVAYLGLLGVTIQVYVASLRQQEIWLNANGLTREYMLRTCLETPAWMLVPGVDGNLVLGTGDAETALSWLWQLLSWNSSMGHRDRWAYEIDGA